MTNRNIFNAMRGIDAKLILDAAPAEKRKANRSTKSLWLRWGAMAACFCLIIGTIVAVPLLRGSDSPPDRTADDPIDPQPNQMTDDSTYTPLIFDANISPELLTGSPMEIVVGSSGSSGPLAAPPDFTFDFGLMVVKAKVVSNLPDVYYELDVSSEYKPTAYRLIQMETTEVIHGENIPQSFFYLIRQSLFVDMSVYDSLLISMTQIGTEHYVMRNGTQNRMEAFPLPVFGDYQDSPELGNVIAFTDGVFDESLWQTESWLYGYQFARFYLDDPEDGRLVVYRGGTESEAIDEIKARIEEEKAWRGDGYAEPHLITPDFQSEEAKAALEYVKPFENGVFSQKLLRYNGNGELVYRRYINGCQTEETVTIDLITEEVTYSKVRYTSEDLSKMENIALQIESKAKASGEQYPTPPHTDPTGKELIFLNLYGWYAKVDGKVYGIVKTVWRYKEEGDWYTQYYDDSYIIYNGATAKYISRDDLIDLVGTRNIYRGEYGVAIEMPMA